MINKNFVLNDMTFVDEVATSFHYNSKKQLLELGFDAYYADHVYVEVSCKLVIEKWKSASSRILNTDNYNHLETSLGIVSMILTAETRENKTEVLINTTDDRYVFLLFEDPIVKLEIAK